MSFQQVVHPVLGEEAEIAKQTALSGRTGSTFMRMPPDAAPSRAFGPQIISGAQVGGAAIYLANILRNTGPTD